MVCGAQIDGNIWTNIGDGMYIYIGDGRVYRLAIFDNMWKSSWDCSLYKLVILDNNGTSSWDGWVYYTRDGEVD